jgi:hypothetical protein
MKTLIGHSHKIIGYNNSRNNNSNNKIIDHKTAPLQYLIIIEE